MGADRLGAARASVAAGFPTAAVSSAYYAMLYAARAALSEEDRYAKTHRGTWNLFGETFVTTGRFERDLFRAARDTQPVREGADYDAVPITASQADEVVALAERFHAAVRELFGE